MYNIIYNMFELFKKAFITLLSFSISLTNIVNASSHTSCISLNNIQCMTQPTLINLHLNECSQGLPYLSICF